VVPSTHPSTYPSTSRVSHLRAPVDPDRDEPNDLTIESATRAAASSAPSM
jgi:hypothetical protein